MEVSKQLLQKGKQIDRLILLDGDFGFNEAEKYVPQKHLNEFKENIKSNAVQSWISKI